MPERVLDSGTSDNPPGPFPDRPSGGGTRRWRMWLLIVGLAAIVGLFVQLRQATVRSTTAKAAPPPRGVPIVTSTAYKGDIGVYIEGLGSVTPVYTVTVTSQGNGQIIALNYREGQIVHKGDSLIEIDPRPYEALLLQYQGQLDRDQALLNESRIDQTQYQQH